MLLVRYILVAPMVSDNLPIGAGHCRHPARGFPFTRYDMTALRKCDL